MIGNLFYFAREMKGGTIKLKMIVYKYESTNG